MLETRPSPDELLRRIQFEERRARRGRLKVFLGYASRVGKSHRMLDEGRRRRMRGEDVVVAVTQASITPEIEELLHTLERIPEIKLQHGGQEYSVIDMPAVFRRRPQVCLIDELAYRNPPGSRNPERWQDVQEILQNGIGVLTAVNLQHIAEYQTRVERITGKRPSQTVPESFIREADLIEIVDAALDSLRERGLSEEELRRMGELRELALLLTADVVDEHLRKYLDTHGIRQLWGIHERILVCLTSRSSARAMLESGRRNADRFHGQLFAAYVRRPGAAPADEAVVEGHLKLAAELGAEVQRLEGADFVETIIPFARSQGITQLFVGHTQNRGWLARLRGSALDRLIARATDMDIRVFPSGSVP